MSKTNQKNAASRMPQKPLTPEERKEQIARAIAQKRAALAETCLFNLLQNPNVESIKGDVTIVEAAIAMADELLAKAYGFGKEAEEEDAE